MDFTLTNDEQEFIESFRTFCKKEIAPFAEELDRKKELPRTHYTKLAEAGYLGLMHEEEYGGQGAGLFLSTLAMEVVSEYCGSTFFSVGASGGLFGLPLKHFGTKEQKKKYLPEIISAKKIGSLGVTEPDSGSDVASITTVAKRSGNDRYLLTGQKTYITNAPNADYCLVLARALDSSGKEKGLTHFIVDLHSKGVSRSLAMDKMGLRASPTGALFFEDVEVPEENILGKLGKGFRQTMQTFNTERLSLAAYSLGVMRACMSDSKSFASSRKSFGKSISQHQAVAFLLAEIYTKLEASKWLTYNVAWESEASERLGKGNMSLSGKCAACKLFATTSAREVTNLAVQVHGGAGFMDEYRVSRLYRDVRLGEIGGGTSEIQKLIISGSLMKQDVS
ncbi:putative acyl-CoA dehydrogenase [Leptospira broomii serovar Hurstbridge str. 5399]|uniref:Acyl-CoA dehydrogenase n=1 Tax=Leptospira broomii serovar Hurstbridge str. 5399 TaxID=1049789 RepID=T0GAF4_9LEPT|nr:acyl-CoA dehydrogenase family protein [Leptospira broomii]EQA43809.1 putative acyl-CoA dehydrogenase [Leptospira broomii serovar Hurstbridge str. 5399]